MEYARHIILFLFEHEHEGYKPHADCTVDYSPLNGKVQKIKNRKNSKIDDIGTKIFLMF